MTVALVLPALPDRTLAGWSDLGDRDLLVAVLRNLLDML